MTQEEQLLEMLSLAKIVYHLHTQKFDHGYTPGGTTVNKDDLFVVVELDTGSRGAYSFIFKKDGSLLTTEPSGF